MFQRAKMSHALERAATLIGVLRVNWEENFIFLPRTSLSRGYSSKIILTLILAGEQPYQHRSGPQREVIVCIKHDSIREYSFCEEKWLTKVLLCKINKGNNGVLNASACSCCILLLLTRFPCLATWYMTHLSLFPLKFNQVPRLSAYCVRWKWANSMKAKDIQRYRNLPKQEHWNFCNG
jgi:hypothetical protein